MKIRFLPKTRLGKWSVIMMISSLVVFVVGSVLTWKPGYSGFEFFIKNPIQGIITVLMLAVGIATSSMAIISIIKNKEIKIMKVLPKSRLGKCSVGLTIFSLMLITTFFAFMLLGLVSFDEGHWWDLTVGVAVIVEIIAFILSIMAVKKMNERSIFIYLSIIIGICVILFLFLHSLFIND